MKSQIMLKTTEGLRDHMLNLCKGRWVLIFEAIDANHEYFFRVMATPNVLVNGAGCELSVNEPPARRVRST